MRAAIITALAQHIQQTSPIIEEDERALATYVLFAAASSSISGEDAAAIHYTSPIIGEEYTAPRWCSSTIGEDA